MNMRSLRKRLDRREKVINAKTEAAALAMAPALKPSQEEDERAMLWMLELRRGLPDFSAEDEAEFKRLSELYPPDEVEPDLPLPPELDFEPFLKSIREILED